MTLYKCGHKHGAFGDKTTEDYVEWKYTVGSNGTKQKCYHCWKDKK